MNREPIQDGGMVVVEIINRGDPIPAELLPVIFKAFHRARGKAKKTANLGLGLYVASDVVRAHGGTLDVRCSDGTTTFTLRLPRVAIPEASPLAVQE